MDEFWITKVVLQKFRRNRSLSQNLSSATQKDAKPMNDHVREAFESHPGIPLSGKTGQTASCSCSTLCSVGTETEIVLRDTVQRLMSADLSRGLEIPWMQQIMRAIGDTT